MYLNRSPSSDTDLVTNTAHQTFINSIFATPGFLVQGRHEKPQEQEVHKRMTITKPEQGKQEEKKNGVIRLGIPHRTRVSQRHTQDIQELPKIFGTSA